MTDHMAQPAHLIGPCPECGNGVLAAVEDDDGTKNLLCRVCGACWHAEFEWTRRVDPARCPGCEARAVCESARHPYRRR